MPSPSGRCEPRWRCLIMRAEAEFSSKTSDNNMYRLSLNYAENSRTGGAGRPRKKLAVSPPASRGRRLCRPMRSVLGKPRSTST